MEKTETLPKLTPEQINHLLKELPDDEERVRAMEGICRCGAIKNGRCWSCYESTDYD